MWIVTGPFGGHVAGYTDFTKDKLLRPGKSYILGRKDCPLSINSKKISRKHLELAVGPYTTENVEDPNFIPTLTLHVYGANRQVLRDGHNITVNANTSCELQTQDIVYALGEIPLPVRWQKVVCLASEGGLAEVSTEECAKIGLATVWRSHADVTHHVISELALSPSVGTSLLSLASFVTVGWVHALLACAGASDSPDEEFCLPSQSQHRPPLSPFLPSALKNYQCWEPNEERLNMLKRFRVIFLGERTREVSQAYKDLVKLGGATYECCAVEGGREFVHRVLAKGSEKGQELVLVADKSAVIAAVGLEDWSAIVNEAASYNLHLVAAESLVEAVVRIDLAYLDHRLVDAEHVSHSSMTPSVILNTHPSEPSLPPAIPNLDVNCVSPPRKQLVRRVGSCPTSRAPSVAPGLIVEESVIDNSTFRANVEPTVDSAQPKKRLTRRAGLLRSDVLGIEDVSAAEEPFDGTSPLIPKHASGSVFSQSVRDLPTRTSRLKRRFGAAQPPSSQLMQTIDSVIANTDEPPHKKYKALFDESEPNNVDITPSDNHADSLTQAETPVGTTKAFTDGMPALLEEEEDSLGMAFENPKGTASSFKDTQDDGNTETDRATTTRKERLVDIKAQASASEGGNRALDVVRRGTLNHKTTYRKQGAKPHMHDGGAAADQPDKDENFLKAVASTKRGRKHEDDFDREFNNLKISKPDLERDRIIEDWDTLKEFNDAQDLRGNFMVVVEMDVYKPSDATRQIPKTTSVRADWEGRPDFKKFKKKAAGERRTPIELVADDDDEMMMGMSYASCSRGQSVSRKQKSYRQPLLAVDDDDDDEPSSHIIKPVGPERRSEGAKTAFQTRRTQPLFLDSENEDHTQEENADSITRQDSDSDAAVLSTRKRPAMIKDDDSDNEFSLRSRMRKKARR